MLGHSLFRARPEIAADCIAKTRRVPAGVAGAIDLDDEPAVAALFARVPPSLIVQCAGVCDVESCEQSPEFAWRVNVEAMEILLRHAPAACRIVYLTSAHQFSGDVGQ